MGHSLSLELSDGLVELSQLLAPYEHEPRVLDPEDARTLRECLREMRIAARRLETEVSRHRWNAMPDDSDRHFSDRVLAAASQPGSTIVLFPAAERPFGDGRPAPQEWR